MPYPTFDYFAEHVSVGDGCWLWINGDTQTKYGRIGYGENGQKKKVTAHRFAYQLLGHVIPEGMTLDHLCCNVRCVRPDHLEPVSLAENTRRARTRRDAVEGRVVLDGVGHGELKTYKHKGCRCDECRAANTKEKARLRRARAARSSSSSTAAIPPAGGDGLEVRTAAVTSCVSPPSSS